MYFQLLNIHRLCDTKFHYSKNEEQYILVVLKRLFFHYLFLFDLNVDNHHTQLLTSFQNTQNQRYNFLFVVNDEKLHRIF